MLQLFESGKATSFFLNSNERVPTEDVITSAVFGIPAFVESQKACDMLRAAFLEATRIRFPEKVESVQLDLWPRERWNANRDRTWIEPDVVANLLFNGAQGRMRLIIEAKWNASLGNKQAISQWKHFGLNHDDAWHVFIGKSASRLEEQLSFEDLSIQSFDGYDHWKRRRVCISWFNIARGLERTWKAPGDEIVRRWCSGVLSALRFFSVQPFEGYGAIALPEMPSEHWTFGAGLKRGFAWPYPPRYPVGRPVFFKVKKGNGAR